MWYSDTGFSITVLVSNLYDGVLSDVLSYLERFLSNDMWAAFSVVFRLFAADKETGGCPFFGALSLCNGLLVVLWFGVSVVCCVV